MVCRGNNRGGILFSTKFQRTAPASAFAFLEESGIVAGFSHCREDYDN
jgi:hypothetical protein